MGLSYLCTALLKDLNMKKLVSVAMVVAWAFQLQAQITYYEVSASAGISHYYGTQFYGSGVSFADFTGDGLDDLTIGTDTSDQIHFYENVGGTFVQLPALVPDKVHTKQVLWVDFDNDGDKDLMIGANQDTTRLYENDGSLNMTDITAAAGLPLDVMPVNGVTFGDYDNDGWLDLYYTTYSGGTWPFTNYLYKNNGNGTFTDVTDVTTAVAGKSPFCASFFDYNNDGWPDIYIANDRGDGNTLLLNQSGTSWLNVSGPSGSGLMMNSMCVAVGDYNADGYSDIYVTNTPPGNKLLENNQDGTFTEVSAVCGVGYHGVGWGSAFMDYDNDLDLDLYVCGMWTDDDTSNVMYENLGASFINNTSIGFVGDTVESYSNAVGDFNDDGYPDLMVTNKNPYASQLWVHTGGTNNFMKIELEGVVSNRDGIGARIDFKVAGDWYMRYTHSAIGYLAQDSDWLILPMGTEPQIDSLIVTWPSGIVDVLVNVPSGWRYSLLEGQTTGLWDEPEVADMLIYPVPANEQVTIQFHMDDVRNADVVITNIIGEAVLTQAATLVSGQNAIAMDVTGLAAGMYTVTVRDGLKRFAVGSLIVK